jgi:predicted HicB family RNase H-like nuclease
MTNKSPSTLSQPPPTLPSLPEGLLEDLRSMINQTRGVIASTINAKMTLLYWQVGVRIRTEILKDERDGYGCSIVSALSRKLTLDYGKGFSEKSLHRMVQFGALFPDEQIVAALLRQLSWTHFTILLPIKDPIKRDFYAEMCRIERWNYRTLQKKIQSMFYERTALSKKPEALIQAEIELLRMKYKGYIGHFEYDDEVKIFHGEVAGLRDIITFQGKSVEELAQAFKDSIDDYLAWCKKSREKPEKTFSGTFNFRKNCVSNESCHWSSKGGRHRVKTG